LKGGKVLREIELRLIAALDRINRFLAEIEGK